MNWYVKSRHRFWLEVSALGCVHATPGGEDHEDVFALAAGRGDMRRNRGSVACGGGRKDGRFLGEDQGRRPRCALQGPDQAADETFFSAWR